MSYDNWEDVKLSDILNFYNGKVRPKTKGNIPVFGGNGIMDYANEYNYSDENIIIGRVGAYCGNVNYYYGSLWISDNAINIKPKEGLSYGKYIYYLLMNQNLHTRRIGSSQPLITQKILKNIEVRVPPFEEQKAIANILSSLDDKIELNNKINKNLEEMAQALYKQWFVDFEFPNENGEPYKSSGGEMIESELGLIPKGWEVKEISELTQLQIGGDWGKEEYFENSVEVTCLRGTDLQKLKESGFSLEAPTRYIKESSLPKRELTNLDIIVGGSGLGPIGRSLYIHEKVSKLYENPMVYSNFCKRIKGIDIQSAIYVEHYLEEMHKSGEINNYVSGTSIPNLDIKGLLKSKIIVPSKKLLAKFSALKLIYFTNKFSNENQVLAKTRDTLLPKLMSGEIEVPIKE